MSTKHYCSDRSCTTGAAYVKYDRWYCAKHLYEATRAHLTDNGDSRERIMMTVDAAVQWVNRAMPYRTGSRGEDAQLDVFLRLFHGDAAAEAAASTQRTV